MYTIFILLLTCNCDLTIDKPKSPIIFQYFRHEPINIFNVTLRSRRGEKREKNQKVGNLAKVEVPKFFHINLMAFFLTIDDGELRDLQITATELSTENCLCLHTT